ncbi:MAG: hypothetical protein ACLUN5_07835 [Oscillospiraceae bacterium]
MRKTTGPAARKVSEWQDLTCWVVELNQRADFYGVVGSSIGNIIKNHRTYFQNSDLHFDNLAYNINKGGDFQNADGRFD